MEYVPPLDGDEENKDRSYIDANPINGVEGSILGVKAIEYPLREIVNAIKGAGITPDGDDLTQLKQAILAYLQPTEDLRIAKVGNPFYGDILGLAENYIPADGRLINLANFPELKEKLENGKLASMEYDETLLLRAEKLGVYMYSQDGLSVYAPELGGSFLRAFTDGQSLDALREIGSVQGDAIRNIKGNGIGGTWITSIPPSGPFTYSVSGSEVTFSERRLAQRIIGILNIDVSRAVPTADENRPQNIAMHTILYLGKYTPVQEAI